MMLIHSTITFIHSDSGWVKLSSSCFFTCIHLINFRISPGLNNPVIIASCTRASIWTDAWTDLCLGVFSFSFYKGIIPSFSHYSLVFACLDLIYHLQSSNCDARLLFCVTDFIVCFFRWQPGKVCPTMVFTRDGGLCRSSMINKS